MTRSLFRYAALRSGVAGCRVHPATSSKCRFFTMSDSPGPSGLKRSAWTTATPVKDRGTATRRCCLRPPLRASASPWRVHRSSQRTWNPAGWFGFFPGACPRDTRTSSCIHRAPRASEKSKCSRTGCSSRSDLSNERTPSSLKPGKTANNAGAHGGAIAHEASRLAIPLGIDPVDRVLEHRGGAVIVLWGDEDEAVGLRDRGGPPLHDFVLVRRATRHGRRQWLIEERHRKVAQIEKPSIDTLALLQVLQDPLRGLFRESALAGASNNDGNDGHAFNPCCQSSHFDYGLTEALTRKHAVERCWQVLQSFCDVGLEL